MSYIYTFSGAFQLNQQLAPPHLAYLQRFTDIRHMQRHVEKIVFLPDPLREAVRLPVGPDGVYFVDSTEAYSNYGNATIADFNRPPIHRFISLWCPWHPTQDGMGIAPESSINDAGGSYDGWLSFIIKDFLQPWGYSLTGVVEAQGEDPNDYHVLRYTDNRRW